MSQAAALREKGREAAGPRGRSRGLGCSGPPVPEGTLPAGAGCCRGPAAPSRDCKAALRLSSGGGAAQRPGA